MNKENIILFYPYKWNSICQQKSNEVLPMLQHGSTSERLRKWRRPVTKGEVMTPFIWNSRIDKPMKTESRLVIVQCWAAVGEREREEGGSGKWLLEYRINKAFAGMMNMFKNLIWWWLHNCINMLKITELCMLNCEVYTYKLYPNKAVF